MDNHVIEPALSADRPTQPVPPWLRALALLALAGALALIDWSVVPASAASSGEAAGSQAASSAATAGVPPGSSAGAQGSSRRRGGAVRRSAAGSTRQAGSSGGAPIPGFAAKSGASVSGAPGSPSAPGASGSGSSPASAGPATNAVNGYLSALAHLDPTGVSDTSDGAPYAMAGILLDSAAINSARGGTTSVTVGPSSLTPTSVGPGTVTFVGSVALTTTVSGSQGGGTYTDTVSGPLTVTDESGVWRVTDFTYDNAPLQLWEEHASQTIRGLTATVGYVVSYGNTTAALVTLTQQSGAADVQLQTVKLTAGGASVLGTGDFTGPPTPTGVLRFSRVDATPSSLELDFSSSGGSPYDFQLPLS
jgi:hypothetical protein